MMRIVFTAITAIVFSLFGHAQLLWKISGKDIQKPSYLFGTHHIAPINVLDSVTGFNEALAASDRVYGEVEMSKLMTPEGQQQLLTAFLAPADSTMSKVFTPAQLDSINTFLIKNLGAPVQAFESYKPVMLQTTIASVLSIKAFPDFNPNQQLDHTVQLLAKEKGKPVDGLETVEDQIQMLTSASIASQAKALLEMIADEDSTIKQSIDLARYYRLGDIVTLQKMFGEDNSYNLENILYRRNRNWVKIMKEQLPECSNMYVVGAGHLPGDKGVINLLRKEGYTVTPM